MARKHWITAVVMGCAMIALGWVWGCAQQQGVTLASVGPSTPDPAPELQGPHHRTRSYGEVTTSRLEWPRNQVTDDGQYSFSFFEYEMGSAVASASLYAVPYPGSPDFFTWAMGMIAKGGPSPEECVPALGGEAGISVSYPDEGTALVACQDQPLPLDSPLYLVLHDARGNVVQEVLFGPLFEDSDQVHALRFDLEERR